jgi:hypothetical protein
VVHVLQLLSPAQLAQFCPETLVVAGKYCQDFEKYGIHLTSSSQRAEVARLLALNQHYPARFNAALVRGMWPAAILCCMWADLRRQHAICCYWILQAAAMVCLITTSTEMVRH